MLINLNDKLLTSSLEANQSITLRNLFIIEYDLMNILFKFHVNVKW